MAANVKLRFDDPIRALYAHAWELTLKACLRRQGMSAEQVRKKFGHDLIALWDAIERDRFPLLQLRDELRPFIEHIGFYHRNRLYAYPVGGARREIDLNYLRATSSRLRLSHKAAVETFGLPED